MYSPIYSNSPSPSIIPPSMEEDDNISEVDSILYTPTSPRNHHYSSTSLWHSTTSSSSSSSSSLRKHKSIDLHYHHHQQPKQYHSLPINHHHQQQQYQEKIETYQLTFEKMNQSINDFLNQYYEKDKERKKNNMSILIHQLKEFRDTLPSQFNITQQELDHGNELVSHLLLWFEENEKEPLTLTSSTSTSLLQQDQLCFPFDILLPPIPNKESEKKKKQRLIQTIQLLVKKNHDLKKELASSSTSSFIHKNENKEKDSFYQTLENKLNQEIVSREALEKKYNEEIVLKETLEKKYNQEIISKKELEKKLNQEILFKEEAEEMVESVRIEMETMMDELDQSKQQHSIYEKEIHQLRQQWLTILNHQKQEHELNDKKEVVEKVEEEVEINKKKEFTPWELLNIQEKDWEYRVDTLQSKLEQQEIKTKQLQTKLRNHKQQMKKEKDEFHQSLQEKEMMNDTLQLKYNDIHSQLKTSLTTNQSLQKEKETLKSELLLQLTILKKKLNEKRETYEQELNQLKKENSHHQQKQEEKELIHALQQEVKEKETLLVNWEKKWFQHQQKLKYQEERQLKETNQDRATYIVELENQFLKKTELFELKCEREKRELEMNIIDLEEQLNQLSLNNESLIQYHHRLDLNHKKRDQSFNEKQSLWEDQEKKSKLIILSLEQKIIGLEEEVMKLYGKNIVLANQLGECD